MWSLTVFCRLFELAVDTWAVIELFIILNLSFRPPPMRHTAFALLENRVKYVTGNDNTTKQQDMRRVPLPLCLLAATVPLAADETNTNIDGWHRTPGQGGVAERVFFPSNNNAAPRCFLLDNEVAHPVQSTEFMQGFAEIQDAIDQSLLGGKRLHPYGSLLSTSNVIFDEENMLESCGLNYVKLGFDEDQVVDASKKDRLAFVQSGVRMKEFNELLYDSGLGLPTSGSVDRQRVVGAIATGTGGSRFSYGPLVNAAKGIHLVTNTEHVYIQKASEPTVTNAFLDFLPAGVRLIEDDEMFQAAIVGVGCFGVIHGLVIEADPLFTLDVSVKTFPLSEIIDVITTLENMESLGFDGIESINDVYHFEAVINPFRTESDQGVFVRSIQQSPTDINNLEPAESACLSVLPDRRRLADDSFGFVDGIFELFWRMWNFIVFIFWSPVELMFRAAERFIYGTLLIPGGIESYVGIENNGFEYQGFPHCIWSLDFNPSGVEVPLFGNIRLEETDTSIAVPISHARQALDFVLEELTNRPIPTAIGLRYLSPSDSLLGLHQYESTMTIDMPSQFDRLLLPDTILVYENMFNRLEEEGIPHTFHLGKMHPNNDEWLERSLGNNLATWRTKRRELLDAAGRDMFASTHARLLGLHQEGTD